MLEARSLDHRARTLLRPGARFAVHSVFERAVNLIGDQHWLLGLVGPRGGNGPATVVLRTLADGGLPLHWLKPGLSAVVDRTGRLVIDGRLAVGLAGAVVWQPPVLPGSFDPRRARTNVNRAAALTYELRGSDGLGGLLPHLDRLLAGGHAPPGLPRLLRTAWNALADLLPPWRAGQAVGVGRAARSLVGLGPGQTPSGDDLLAGLMVASQRTSTLVGGPRRIAAPVPRAVLDAAEGRTTDLGLARLRYAAEGELDERSELALAALLAGDATAVEATTRELLAYGHSSGLDTLVGLLLGIRCWVLGIGDGP
jgi:hypothetical protein